MPKGVINPRWELAADLARKSGNETKQNIARILKEFKAVESEGYSLDLALACLEWLQTREQFPIPEARVITVLKGTPVYLEQYKKYIVEAIPPVWDADSHDTFVKSNGKILKSLGFTYRCENQAGRLTTDDLIQCGLKERLGE